MSRLPDALVAPRDGRRSRVGTVIAMLSSTSGGEVAAAAEALRRMLALEGCDIHSLVDHTEGARLRAGARPAEVKAAYAQGNAAVVSAAHATARSAEEDDAEDDRDREMAVFVKRRKRRLNERHHEFVDDIALIIRNGHRLTEKQRSCLRSRFERLGGE